MRKIKKSPGQALLISILMITAASLAIGLVVATISSEEVKLMINSRQANQAYGLAETCLENTLMRMARTDLTKMNDFTNNLGSCTINIVGSNPYTVTATGKSGKSYRKIESVVSISNEVLNIQSRKEVF